MKKEFYWVGWSNLAFRTHQLKILTLQLQTHGFTNFKLWRLIILKSRDLKHLIGKLKYGIDRTLTGKSVAGFKKFVTMSILRPTNLQVAKACLAFSEISAHSTQYVKRNINEIKNTFKGIFSGWKHIHERFRKYFSWYSEDIEC